MAAPRLHLAAWLTVSFLLFADNAGAEMSLHGFAQGNYGLNTASANPDGRDAKLAEERLQLKLEADQGQLRLFVKTDLAWDHLGDRELLELREGSFVYASTAWDLKLGRQMLTWGLGDLVFINDVFPKDYEAFFSGRPMEYMKKGVDGVKLGLYPEAASFELVAIPRFTANYFPEARRFWLFDPLPGVTNRQTVEPGGGQRMPRSRSALTVTSPASMPLSMHIRAFTGSRLCRRTIRRPPPG